MSHPSAKIKNRYLSQVESKFGGRITLVGDSYQAADKTAEWYCSDHDETFKRSPYLLVRSRGCKKCGNASIAAARKKGPEALAALVPEGFTVTEFTSMFAPAEVVCDTTGEVFKIRNVSQAVSSGSLPHQILAKRASRTRREAERAKVKAELERRASLRGYKPSEIQVGPEGYRYALRQHLYKRLSAKFPATVFDLRAYKNNQSTVRVWCPDHGWESTTVSSLLSRKHRCSVCAKELSGLRRRRPFESFAEEATKIHKGRFRYIEQQFKSMSEPSTAICLLHGEFKIWPSNHLQGDSCPQCSGSVSTEEVKLRSYISRSYAGPLVFNHRVGRKELDVFAPELKLGVEYDGVWWHSTKFSSRDPKNLASKHKAFEALGIRTVHIFSDEWCNRPHATKHYLDRLVGNLGKRVHARGCEVVEVSKQRAKTFLNAYHIQGYTSATYLGLMSEGELVAVMGFNSRGSSRKSRGEGVIELVRYATSSNVSGGAGKLMTHFLRDNPEVTEVVSFSDNRLFSGGLYRALGFRLDKELPPDYTYTRNSERLHKSAFQKSRLAKKWRDFDPSKTERENCEAHGYYQVYDCGKKRWVWSRTN